MYSGTVHWCLWRCGRHHTTTTTTTTFKNVSCLTIWININNWLNYMCLRRVPEKYIMGAALNMAAIWYIHSITSVHSDDSEQFLKEMVNKTATGWNQLQTSRLQPYNLELEHTQRHRSYGKMSYDFFLPHDLLFTLERPNTLYILLLDATWTVRTSYDRCRCVCS
jgi:hypothetical protein